MSVHIIKLDAEGTDSHKNNGYHLSLVVPKNDTYEK